MAAPDGVGLMQIFEMVLPLLLVPVGPFRGVPDAHSQSLSVGLSPNFPRG